MRNRVTAIVTTAAVATTAWLALPGAAWAGSSTAGSSTAGTSTAGTSTAGTSTAGTSAAGAANLSTIKQLAATAISERLGSIASTLPAVASNPYLSPTDKSTLTSTLDSDQSGLTALGQKIASDTTLAAARADYGQIFSVYRVYALALPQVRMAAACDDLTGTVLPRLENAQQELQGLLQGADSSKDNGVVPAAMSDLATQIADIQTATNGLSTTLLGYTPAQWDANHALLSTAHSDITSARSAASRATADIATVVEALR